MIEPGLRKATTVSFVVHLVFLSILLIAVSRSPDFIMPSPYTVSLVSPDAADLKSARVPPRKTYSGPVVDAAEPEAAPKENKEKRTAKAKPEKPSTELMDYAAERKRDLIAKKAEEQYLADLKQALEAKRKLRQVKALGSEKAQVKVTAKAAGAGVPGGEASVLIGDYASMVAALIQQEWAFLDTGVGDISATVTVKVLKSGALVVTRVEQPSGNARFDRAAIKAINKASPVEPPPYEIELGLRFCPGQMC